MRLDTGCADPHPTSMSPLPQLSLLVQIPGPEGRGLLLEDLRIGRQQLYGSPAELLQELAARLASAEPPPGGPTSNDTPTLREPT